MNAHTKHSLHDQLRVEASIEPDPVPTAEPEPEPMAEPVRVELDVKFDFDRAQVKQDGKLSAEFADGTVKLRA